MADEVAEPEIEPIVLSFTPGLCARCGAGGPPGRCSECDGEIVLLESDPMVVMRQRALGASSLRADELLAKFDCLPDSRIPISGDQFAVVIREAQLDASVARVLGLVDDLRGLDLGKSKLLGGRVRGKVEAGLGRVEELLDLCRELAHFEPEGPAAELREVSLKGGRHGATVIAKLLRTATAGSYAECLTDYSELEALLAGDIGAQLADVRTRAENWESSDVNARIALALGMSEFPVDGAENLEIGAVLMAFADEEEPHAAIASCARRYFSHVLGSSESAGGGDSILIAPLFLLAATERPLRAHRAAQLLAEALRRAHEKDARALQGLLDQTVTQGPIIYTALGRVRRAFEAFEGNDEDELILQQLMAVYVELSESAFRTIGWLAVRLVAIGDGEAPDMRVEPPTLGQLRQELNGAGALGELLADSNDGALRNAAAHSQYGWDSETEEVKDLRTGQRWSVEDFVDRLQNLFGCLAGVEAGYACFLADTQIDLQPPPWLADFPSALQMLVELCFAPLGFTVVEARNGGADVVIERPEVIDPARLIPPLAGMLALNPKADALQVLLADDDRPIIDITATATREAHAAGDLQDLKMAMLAYESAVRTRRTSERSANEYAVVLAKVVAVSGLRRLDEEAIDRGTFKLLRRRFVTVSGFVQQETAADDLEMRDLRTRLGKLQALSRSASSGGVGSLGRLTDQLHKLESWADSKGVHWPPTLEAD